ncbi:MAG: DUF6340 family protein [Tannerella sp.]|jgi:hypothetical protein|nr:DUF6340 family protein [Tannerella sp.]
MKCLDFQKRLFHLLITTLLIWLGGAVSCAPYRYVGIDTYNPAQITFPAGTNRILIVNHALSQQEVPFESSMRTIPDSITISADSTHFDFCQTLGEALAGFPGFEDVRLLEGNYRKDFSPLSAPALNPDDVIRLCDEHESDVVISLDRLLFQINEHSGMNSGIEMAGFLDVVVSGVLRVYLPGRETPMTTVMVADTVRPQVWFNEYGVDVWAMFFSVDFNALLRESAKYSAFESRKNFAPYWNQDVRWYYFSFPTQWKEASAYAEADKWSKALEIWESLYSRAKSWKQQARLCSNIALGSELTGDPAKALTYAEKAHQLMLSHLGADDATVKRQKVYVDVLTFRIVEERKLQIQMRD